MLRRAALIATLAACGRPADHEVPDAAPAADAAAGSATPTVTVELVTDQHRAVPGAMFGGWGPHLGHLVGTTWIDDLCSPAIAGDCDVDVDRRVGVFARTGGTWIQRATIALSGVQQNTAAIEVGGTAYVYGVAGRTIVECTEAAGCTAIPIDIGDGANYVGAAVVPGGGRVVWWTNVVDGGGGSFAYLVNYGGGWNGPRSGGIGGYNDCAYAHVAFDGSEARWFCQVVSGLGPNWSYATLVGSSAQTLAEPVAWASGLVPPAGDSVMSTNDLWVDASGGEHLLARSTAGAALYYYGVGGAYELKTTLPATYRARWVPTRDTLALVHDVDQHTALIVRTAPRTSGVLDIGAWTQTRVPLPVGFGEVYAIYPLSPAYQDATIDDVEFVVVGSGDEHAAYHVTFTPTL